MIPLIAFSNIFKLFLITSKKILNFYISCRRKLVIDGNILSLSPKRWSGIFYVLIGFGNCWRFDIIYNKLLLFESFPDYFGWSICIQFNVFLDYWIIKLRLAFAWRPNTYGVSIFGRTLSIVNMKS